MAKDNTWILVIGIIALILIIIFGKNLGLFATFTQTFVWKGINWEATSNYDFGTFSIPYLSVDTSLINEIETTNELKITHSQSWGWNGQTVVNPFRTGVTSTNLNINPSNLQKIEISSDSSVSSGAGCGGFSAVTSFYLIDNENNLHLISSISASQSSKNAYNIIIEKSLDRWVVSTMGGGSYVLTLDNTKRYNLHMGMVSGMVSGNAGCAAGASNSGEIKLYDINIIQIATPSPTPTPTPSPTPSPTPAPTASPSVSPTPTPPICTQDTKECPDGTYVSRNPNNNCNFYPCEDCLFKISSFCVKLWMLLTAIGIIIVLVATGRKR